MSGPHPTHLFRRGAVYWVRFRLPRDLHRALECTELRRSLGVKDLAAAKKRCLAATLWFHSTLDALRDMPSPSIDDLERAAAVFFQRLRREVALENLGTLDDREIDRLLRTSDERVVELDRQLGSNDFDIWVERNADQLCAETSLIAGAPDKRERRWALRLAARAERAKFAGLIHDLSTPGTTYEPTDALFREPLSPPPLASPRLPSSRLFVREAADKYELRLADRNLGSSHITETARSLKWLCEVVGDSTPLHAITTDQLRSFRDDISRLAARRGTALRFADRLAKTPDERIKSVTAIRYWTAVRSFFKWAVDDGHITDDPTARLRVDRRKGEDRASPEPFSPDEVRRLAQTPLYLGYRSANRVNELGEVRVRNGRWWSMILLLHTGMRAGEASQLLPTDFKFDDEVPHIKLRETDDTGRRIKSLKTKSSVRDVPIHPDLLTLGLRQFVERRAARYPSRVVFTEFRPGADGRHSDGMTKFWGHYLRKHGLHKPGRATHVGRHVVVDQLRRANVPEEDIGAIVGHAPKTVTAFYGGAFPLKRKADSLAKLDFGFDLVGVFGGPFDPKHHGE